MPSDYPVRNLSGENRLLPQPAAAADAGARIVFARMGRKNAGARIVFARTGKMQGAESGGEGKGEGKGKGKGKEFTLRK